MATEAHIQAPVCETKKEELGESNKIPNIALTREEKNQQADTLNEPCTVEGDNFLETHSTSKVHSEVKSDDSTEKPEIRGDGSCMEHEGSEKESEKLIETEISTGKTNGNESEVDNKVRDENAYRCRVESLESEKITSVVLNDDLHVISEDTQDSNKTKGYLEEQSTNAKLQAITSNDTEEKIEFGVTTEAGACEIETSTRSMLPEIESNIEKPEDSSKSDSSNEIETSSIEEHRATAHPQDGKTDDKAVEIKEEIYENVSTIDSNEKTEQNSLIQVGGPQKKNEEHSEKDIEEPSLGNEDLLETSTNKGLDRRATNVTEHGNTSDITEAKKFDAVINIQNEVLENSSRIGSNEETEEKKTTEADHSELPEKESEKPSLPEPLEREASYSESTVAQNEDAEPMKAGPCEIETSTRSMLPEIESNTEKPEDSSHVASEDITKSNSSYEIETSYIDEPSLTANPQSIMSGKTTDATETKEINHENVATEIPHEHTENDEYLEKESENLPLTEEAPVEETNDNEFKLHESKDLIKAELLENEKNTVTTSVKEEAQEEKRTGYLQATHDDTKASESTHVTDRSLTEEEIPTAEPQEISNDEKQETATADAATTHELQDLDTITLHGEDKNDSLIKEDGSEVTHEARFVEEQSLKADLLEEEKHEEIAVKKEIPIESLQVSDEDTKSASALVQDREISSLEEQSLTTDSHGVMGVNEDKTNEATIVEKESQNAVTTTSYENSEDNSQTRVDVSLLEQRKHLEKESENKPLTEASAKDTVENALEVQSTNANLHAITSEVKEDKNEDGEATTAGLCEIETSPRSMLSEMESNIEKPEDSSNVASEDIKISDLSYEIETSSIEEQRATAHPEDGNTDDKSFEIKEEIYENVSTIDSNEKTEENSSIQIGGPQKKNEEHLEKDVDESLLGNEDLVESEEKSSTSMNKDLDRRATSVNEHGNTSDITEVEKFDAVINIQNEVLENSSRVGSNEETKEKGTTKADHSELPEKESEKPASPEPLEREASYSESTVTQNEDAEPTKAGPCEIETSTRSMLPEIESNTEKPEDSSNVASEDITTSNSSYEIETSSIEEQRATAHPEDGKTDDKAALDAEEVKEEIHENAQPIVPNEEVEENSLIQVDASQNKDERLEKVGEEKSMIKEHSEEIETCSSEEQSAHSQIILDQEIEDKAIDAAETKDIIVESTVMHEAEINNESIRKVGLPVDEKNIDIALLKKENFQEAAEDHKTSVSHEDIETTCSIDEPSLTANPQSIMSGKMTDATETKEMNHENVATEIPHEHTENDEHLEKESEILPLTEAPVEETNGNESKLHESEDLIKAELLENERNTVTALVKEEAQEEKHTDYLQETHDDTKASESTHVTDMSLTEEKFPTPEPQEISNDKKQETTTADAAKTHELQDIETITLDGDDKNNSLVKEDGSEENSLKEISLGKADGNVSAVTDEGHEARFLEEQLLKADLLEEEKHEAIVVKEEIPIESLQVSDEDTKAASALVQDRETSSVKEQIPVADPQEISSDKIEEYNMGAAYTEEKTPEDGATKVPNWDNDDNLPTEVYGSLETCSKEASTGTTNDDASINIHDAKFVDENLTKVNLFKNEKNIECTSLEKEVVIESLKEADEDIKACTTFQDRETASLVDQDQIMDHKITEAAILEEEILDEKETETNITSGKNEDNSASKVDVLQEPSLTEVLDYESKIVHEPRFVDESFLKADSVGKEKIADGASEEHMMISNKHIINVTSSASEPSEQDIDKTYTEKLPMLDNCSTIQTPINEDPTKGVHTDAEGPNEENKAKSKQQDTSAEISEDASEPNLLNCDEEGSKSTNLDDVSDSSKSVAFEEVSSSNVASETDSTPNPSQESRKETRVEAENKDDQKQDEDDLCVSAHIQDSSIEKDAELGPEITREMQKLEEAPLPGPDENMEKNTDYKESEAAEDKIITERENKEREYKQENIFLDEKVEDTKETASIPIANDVVPKSFIETSEIDHSTANLETGETHTDEVEETKIDKDKDKEEEACELIISESDSSSPAPNITEVSDKDGAYSSIAEIEAKIDDEAPEIIQAAPSATESQEVEVIKVREALASVAEGEREEYMHAKIGIEEKTDSNQVGFASEESKGGHEVKNQKINEEDDVKNDQIDSCKDIAETHLEHQAKQEENTNTREIFEEIKNTNETEKVSKVSEQADGNVVEEPQEYVDNNRKDKTIDATDLKAETSKENAPKSVVVEIPSTKDLDVNKEHVIVSNEHVADVTSSVSEPSEQDIHKIDAEKITMIDDGSTKIPTKEDPVETGPTESSVKADGQVPDEEIKKEESEQQDISVGNSEDVSKSNIGDISETDSTPNPSLESAAENEEAQKQDEDGLCVSASVQDSSTEKIEKDVESYLASAIDSETIQEMQKLEEATESFLNDEKHTEREHEETECKQEKALLDETLEETKEPASVVVTVADDVIPKSFTDDSTAEGWLTINRGDTRTHDNEEETKLDKNKEDGAGEPKISDFSSTATDIIEASGKDESEIDYEAQEIIQTAPSATETREVENISVSASISEREQDGKQSNEFGFSPEESKSGYEVKNQVLDNAQSCGVISKVEENLEAEIKSETVIVEDMNEPKKIKEKDEYVKNDHRGSCEEEAIAEGQIEDQPKQEEKANSEETFEVITNENVTEKVPKVFEEADGKAVEEKLRTNESIDRSLHQKGQGNSVDDVTTISGTEKVRELDHSHIISTGTQDSEEEVNKSSVNFLEDEDKSTDIIENEIAKEEGLLNQISNTSVKDAVSKEQPERPDKYIIYEAPPALTVPKASEDGEDKKEYADTIMIQRQEEYNKSKHESDSLENEVHLMISAEKNEDEAKNEGTLSKPTEDEVEITYAEAGNVDVPSHTEDTAQSDKKQESQRQIDTLPILPVAKCSDTEIAEKNLPTECSGLGADNTKNINPENSVDNKKPTAIESELPKNSVLETDEATCEREVKTSQGTATSMSQTEKTDGAEHEDTETGEEKDESSEERQLELCSEAPVMVDIGDADAKVAHKKSHNILSGVGSKVKHSIAKVKKAITGKSSHPKPPATIIQSNLPPSPK